MRRSSIGDILGPAQLNPCELKTLYTTTQSAGRPFVQSTRACVARHGDYLGIELPQETESRLHLQDFEAIVTRILAT